MFSERYIGFDWFGFHHLMALVMVIFLWILIIVFKSKITPKFDLYLRRGIAISLVWMEWMFYGWHLIRDGFQTSLLPFGVCALSMYFTAIALWFNSEKIFKFIFPWAIAGALISLFFANLEYTFPHFRYFHYFYNHGIFFLGMLYLLVVKQFRLTYKDLLKSSLILLIYAGIMYPINFLIDANHLFLREVPAEAAPLYSFLGHVWVIGFVISIALLFQIIYLPVMLYQRKRG